MAFKSSKKSLDRPLKPVKVTRGWSLFAENAYGDPGSMCADGRAVYNKVVELEDRGLSPDEVLAYFRRNRNSDLSFITDTGEYESFREDHNHSDLIDAIRDLRNRDEHGFLTDADHKFLDALEDRAERDPEHIRFTVDQFGQLVEV